ncbi:MAG: response regulator [Candidatus Eisenbacteria bacterium]|uniref:histidine kinase n=1 Tax=Eiseniibacteriota bacterium TaxID=2212470 RepID=A0A849SQP8_UNCEI|nr:response regulator [Candidatus Eisenbacteria bacterium]
MNELIPPTPASSNESGSAARILVVDDEPSVADVCSEYLGSEGYEVTVAVSGEEAVRVIPQLRPDVILTDINLPGVSGLEVVKFAKQLDADACVIVVTGYASTTSAVEALRQGAYEYVTKPFDLEAVHKIVKSGIKNRRLKEQNRQILVELREKNEQLSRHEVELRERVRVATQQLRTLYDVNQEISANLELVHRVELITARAALDVHARSAVLYLRREGTDDYRAASTNGRSLHHQGADSVDFRHGEGWFGACVASERSLRWDPSAGVAPVLPGVMPAAAESLAAIPLVSEGSVVGLLVASDREGGFHHDEENYLTLFASQAAIAIRNSQLYEHTKSLDRLKSEFVAVVSHEIRTPLTSIKGAIELLGDAQYFQNNDQQNKLLTIAHANTERLLVLIGDILDFSKLESASLPMHLERQRIEPVVQQAAQNIRTLLADKQLRLELADSHDVPDLMIDADRIGQVVTNLLSNAVKFSPAGGRIDVTVERSDEFVKVSIKDQGEGIATHNLSRLFQKFSQVDTTATRRAGGTGLGLVICKGIVEQHGGTIHVETTVGVGSSFYFLLPLTPIAGESARAIQTDAARTDASSTGSTRSSA